MFDQSDPITADHLALLHPRVISDPSKVNEILMRARAEHVVLWRGMNMQVLPETAVIRDLANDTIQLKTRGFERHPSRMIRLNLALDGIPYFFTALRIGSLEKDLLTVAIPSRLYQTERRTRLRMTSHYSSAEAQLRVVTSAGIETVGELADVSPSGAAVLVPVDIANQLSGQLVLHIGKHDSSSQAFVGEVRNSAPAAGRPGWVRLGLLNTGARRQPPIPIEYRLHTRVITRFAALGQRLRVFTDSASGRVESAGAFLRRRPEQLPEVKQLDFENSSGEQIRALANSWGNPAGAPVVIIPPAWGRTKETLLPLALAIIETFRAANQPITVVRFDGIRKRGESHNDPECRRPGAEHLRFTFSQGVSDIHATLNFLERSPLFGPSKTILVTFSAASLDGRRALAIDDRGRINGWICVVGSSDLQSMMRVISGGVDYVGGVERGIEFGAQEVLGVVVDIDHAGRDALANRMAFLEEAIEDMRGIRVPITWIHGRHDAWMDLERIRTILSAGDQTNRRLLEVPTGHQLRTSWEALDVFQLVSQEISRLVLGKSLRPALPDLKQLKLHRKAERARLPSPTPELKSFWKQYLLGRGESGLGIDLMTGTTAYQEFMRQQVDALALIDGIRVADLGSGTGSFLQHLARERDTPVGLRVDEFDFVRGALQRAREREAARQGEGAARVSFVTCDLGSDRNRCTIPAKSGGYDALLASLVLGYVSDPAGLLREIRRVVRPKGCVVLSSLRRDADVSKIFRDGYRALQDRERSTGVPTAAQERLEASARDFLNDAARLLDLEEVGVFQFWDETELADLMRRSGFVDVATFSSFGVPPQAVIVSGRRP